MLKVWTILLAVVVMVTLAVQSASANTLAYEPFIGSAGELVGQDTGGTGFSVAWGGGTGVGAVYGDNDGVNYTDSNGKVLVQSGYSIGITSAQTNMSDVFRSLSSTISEEGTYYVSAVFRATNDGTYFGIGLPNSNAVLGLMKTSGTAVGWGLYSWDNSTGPRVSATKSQPAMLVAKIVKNSPSGNDTVTLWVNPLLGDETGSGSGTTAEITGTSAWSGISTVAWDNSGKTLGYVADVRFGTTFAGVTPFITPEPASMILLSLSGLFVIRRRNRM